MFFCNGLDEKSVAYIVNYVKHKGYVVSYFISHVWVSELYVNNRELAKGIATFLWKYYDKTISDF